MPVYYVARTTERGLGYLPLSDDLRTFDAAADWARAFIVSPEHGGRGPLYLLRSASSRLASMGSGVIVGLMQMKDGKPAFTKYGE